MWLLKMVVGVLPHLEVGLLLPYKTLIHLCSKKNLSTVAYFEAPKLIQSQNGWKISYCKSYMPFQKYIGQNMNDDTFISGWDFVSKLSNISQKMIKTEN